MPAEGLVTVSERKDQPEVVAGKGGQDNFGMAVQDITPEIARYLGIQRKGGVIVVKVEEGSPADEVGIQTQDIILQVNKVKITSMKDYVQEMARKNSKGSVMLLIKRGQATFFVALRK